MSEHPRTTQLINQLQAENTRLRNALSAVFLFEADAPVTIKKSVWNRLYEIANPTVKDGAND